MTPLIPANMNLQTSRNRGGTKAAAVETSDGHHCRSSWTSMSTTCYHCNPSAMEGGRGTTLYTRQAMRGRKGHESTPSKLQYEREGGARSLHPASYEREGGARLYTRQAMRGRHLVYNYKGGSTVHGGYMTPSDCGPLPLLWAPPPLVGPSLSVCLDDG